MSLSVPPHKDRVRAIDQRKITMSPRKIIIDTDPGQDDAVAMLLAFGSPAELEVLGVTTVAGNVPLRLTERNARIVCELAGKTDIPVFAGHDAPLARPLVTAEHVHGKTGLDGPEMILPTMPLQDKHAVDFIIETVAAEPADTVTICTLGPQTNLAAAFQRAPDVMARVQEIIMMGGAYFEQGNITPSAEFNIYVDPEAAAVVQGAGRPVTILPLDATHQALCTAQNMRNIRAIDSHISETVIAWLMFFERFDRQKYNSDGAPLHDPLVIGYLLAPELFKGRRINVEVETTADLTLGATVADWWGVTDRPKNATFIRDVDAAGFFELLAERLARL